MGYVKNQGQCGSCASFGTTSVIEGMRILQLGESYTRLSEQYGLDCARVSPYNNYSCNGGWMSAYFRFYADNGTIAESDYPY